MLLHLCENPKRVWETFADINQEFSQQNLRTSVLREFSPKATGLLSIPFLPPICKFHHLGWNSLSRLAGMATLHWCLSPPRNSESLQTWISMKVHQDRSFQKPIQGRVAFWPCAAVTTSCLSPSGCQQTGLTLGGTLRGTEYQGWPDHQCPTLALQKPRTRQVSSKSCKGIGLEVRLGHSFTP